LSDSIQNKRLLSLKEIVSIALGHGRWAIRKSTEKLANGYIENIEAQVGWVIDAADPSYSRGHNECLDQVIKILKRGTALRTISTRVKTHG